MNTDYCVKEGKINGFIYKRHNMKMYIVNTSSLTHRMPHFDFSGGDPLLINSDGLGGTSPESVATSICMNALSLFIPAGERLFAKSVRRSLSSVDSKVLRDEIDIFCSQEASHSYWHIKYNQQLTTHKSLRLYEKYAGRFLDFCSKKNFLGIPKHLTVVGEIFTSSASLRFLSMLYINIRGKRVQSAKQLDPIVQFWSWHSVEEIEHHHIPYHAFKYGSKSRLKLKNIFGIFAGMTVLFSLHFLAVCLLSFKMRKYFSIKTAVTLVQYLMGFRSGLYTIVAIESFKLVLTGAPPFDVDTSKMQKFWYENFENIISFNNKERKVSG